MGIEQGGQSPEEFIAPKTNNEAKLENREITHNIELNSRDIEFILTALEFKQQEFRSRIPKESDSFKRKELAQIVANYDRVKNKISEQ